MADTVLYEVSDGLATITLNRPEAMNALDIATKVALREAVQAAADDSAVRAVLLTAAGERAFCGARTSRSTSRCSRRTGRPAPGPR